MNTISKVAASALLAALTVSSINAGSKLVINGDDQNTSLGATIYTDRSGGGEDANLTFKPTNIDATHGSSFRMVFTNGGFVNTKVIMCAELNATTLERVGQMYSKGDNYTSGLITEPRFQFDDDANESIIKRDSNITFHTDDSCTDNPTISSTAGNCKTISVKIDQGRTTTGLDYSDYDTNSLTIGETAQAVKVSCKTPVCYIDATKGKKEYGANTTSGINQLTTSSTDYDENDFTCYNCEQAASICSVEIIIQNSSSDFNVTGYDFVAKYSKDGCASGTCGYIGAVTVDSNASDPIAYTMGNKISFTGLNISDDANQTLTLTYTPNKTDELTPGIVTATLDGFDSNITDNDISTKWTDKKVTAIEVAGKTEFVVPYMNAVAKSFVRVATGSTVATTLEAAITDNDGKTCNLTLDNIPANGASVIWASDLKTKAAAAGCSLTSDLYTVKFSTDGAATVVSYMRTSTGERTVLPFDSDGI
jgi:uncharacterized cupredoxin-like copper-binding protein